MKLFYILLIMFSSTAWSVKDAIDTDENLALANQIERILNQKELNYQSQDWNRLARKTQFNVYFNDFSWWFDTLSQIKTNENFQKTCDQYFYREDNNPMQEYLTKYIRKYCIEVFLKDKKILSKDEYTFVLDNHSYFFDSRSFLVKFKPFLKQINDKGQEETFQNVLKLYVEEHFSSELLSLISDTQFKKELLEKRNKLAKLKKIANIEKRKLKLLFKKLKRNRYSLDLYIVNFDLLGFQDYREAVYRIIHFYIRNKNKEKSLNLLKNAMASENVDSELAFLYLWWGIRFNEEKFILDSFVLKEDFSKEPKTMFWYAQNLQNVGKVPEAIVVYEKIIAEYTVNYYSIMANKKIKQLKPGSDILKEYVLKNKNIQKQYTLKSDVLTKLDRLDLWMKLRARKILEMDIRSIQSKPNKELYNELEAGSHEDKHQINLMIADKLHENEFSLMAFRFFFDLFNSNDVTILDLKGLHPVKQLDLITKYNQSLDPLVIISLIKQESGFNTRAKSHVGASGLMQIMPATARKLSGKRKNNLQDVEYNIKLGTKYLDLLNKRWDGNLVYVLSSYNAGEARVQEWIKNYFNGDDLVGNIEAIPFLETNNYVKLIFRNLYFYKMTQDLSAEDNEKVNYMYDVYLGF